MKQCQAARLRRGGRPRWENCLERRALGNKHSSLIIKKDASWGSLLRMHRGREEEGGWGRPRLLS